MPDIWGFAAIPAKLMLYIGVMGAAGLVIVQIVFADLLVPLRGRLRAQVRAFAGLALGAAALGFLLRGAALTGDASGMIDPEMLGLLWQTPVGDALVFRVLGALIVIAGLYLPLVGRWVSLIGGVLLMWSFAQLGHVPELDQTGVRLLLVLHLAGIAFWIGVLDPLRLLSRRPAQIEQAALLGERFGKVAALAVPVLLLAGLGIAWLLLGDLRALVSTGYGLALLVKLALVGLILMLAAANKLRFVPAMRRGDDRAARHLARSIEIETMVILGVLAVTAVLTSVMAVPN